MSGVLAVIGGSNAPDRIRVQACRAIYRPTPLRCGSALRDRAAYSLASRPAAGSTRLHTPQMRPRAQCRRVVPRRCLSERRSGRANSGTRRQAFPQEARLRPPQRNATAPSLRCPQPSVMLPTRPHELITSRGNCSMFASSRIIYRHPVWIAGPHEYARADPCVSSKGARQTRVPLRQ